MKPTLHILNGYSNLQVQADAIFIALKELEIKAYYRKEIRGLKTLLNHVNQSINTWSYWNSDNVVFTQKGKEYTTTMNVASICTALVEKKKRIEHMLIVASRLIHSYEEDDEIHYEECRKELQPYLNEYDVWLLTYISHPSAIYCYEEKSEFKRLSNRLRALLYKRITGIRRDLRILIRRTTKFFLLGLDDESDAAVIAYTPVFAVATIALQFNHQLIPVNGKIRNTGPPGVH